MPLIVPGSDEASVQPQDAATHRCLMDDEEDSQLYGLSCCMDESSRDRMAEATVFLQPLNRILEEANSKLSFDPLPTQGDGYCFFYVAAGVCSMEVSQTAARQVFACALEASCSEPDAKMPSAIFRTSGSSVSPSCCSMKNMLQNSCTDRLSS